MSSLNDMVVGRQSFADEGVGKRFPTYSRAPRKTYCAPPCAALRGARNPHVLHVHSGSCAPGALHSGRSRRFFEVPLLSQRPGERSNP